MRQKTYQKLIDRINAIRDSLDDIEMYVKDGEHGCIYTHELRQNLNDGHTNVCEDDITEAGDDAIERLEMAMEYTPDFVRDDLTNLQDELQEAIEEVKSI